MKLRLAVDDFVYGPDAGDLAGTPIAGGIIHIEGRKPVPVDAAFSALGQGAVDSPVVEVDVPLLPGECIMFRAYATANGLQSPYSKVVTYIRPFPPLPAPRIQSVADIFVENF